MLVFFFFCYYYYIFGFCLEGYDICIIIEEVQLELDIQHSDRALKDEYLLLYRLRIYASPQ